MVSVHKKNSRSEPNSYRPVSLLSGVGKVLERIVAEVICQHLSENHLLSERLASGLAALPQNSSSSFPKTGKTPWTRAWTSSWSL